MLCAKISSELEAVETLGSELAMAHTSFNKTLQEDAQVEKTEK